MSKQQRQAAAALLATVSPLADELGGLFARAGHELALVGGSVRDVFLVRRPGDLDLTTDAPPQRVLELIGAWADQVWTIGIGFGTVGLRKGSDTFEITTYRSEHYERGSRKPEVEYGTSLEDDLARRDFTVNAMAARLPGYDLVDPFGGLADLKAGVLQDARQPAGLLRRRSAADAARGPVRRAAGVQPAPGAAGRHGASWPPGCPSCPPSG